MDTKKIYRSEIYDPTEIDPPRNSAFGSASGSWDWDLETDNVTYCPRWKQMLGYNVDELDSTLDTWKSLVHVDDLEPVMKLAQAYIEGRANSYEVEMRMLKKQGEEITILSRAFLINDANGKAIRLVGTHTDLTEQAKSENFILATTDILKMIATRVSARTIYDSIALLYESRHPGLRCSMLLLSDNKLLHAGAPSLPKEYCEAVNGLENGPCVGSCGTATYFGKRVLVKDIATDPKWEKIKHIALPHGMRCCWSEPIKNSEGVVLGAFGMYYDHPALPNENEAKDLASAARLAGIIMEREKEKEELDQYRNHLEELVDQRTLELELVTSDAEQANRSKSIFLSNMSHELRTPLNAIIGFGQILEADPTAPLLEAQKASVSHILNSGEHLLELIDEILDLSQIEEGKLSLNLEPVGLRHLFKDALKLVQPIAKKRDILVPETYSTDSSKDLYVTADQLRLKQVLLNLLANAIKYNKCSGSVRIQVEEGIDRHHIKIIDEGIGIGDEQMDMLFEPFNRLGAEAKDIKGTGIGLTITKHLVELMGGELTVKSKVGQGSTFTVSLPTTIPEGELAKASNEEPSPVTASPEKLTKILYVEDNHANVELVKKMIQWHPHLLLLTAETGEEGIQLAITEQPALILMDINLPGISGLEAFKLLQLDKQTSAIPVVGVSATATLETIEECRAAGFADYVTKPFRIERLLGSFFSVLAENEQKYLAPEAQGFVSDT